MTELQEPTGVPPRTDGGVRVLAMGMFDLFHVGHLRYLHQARAMGDHLSVAVGTDAMSIANKGKRPVIDEAGRLEIIRGLACVDTARLVPSTTEEAETATRWILDWGINLVCIGASWQGSARWLRLEPMLARHGIAVRYIPETTSLSTTDLLRRIRASA